MRFRPLWCGTDIMLCVYGVRTQGIVDSLQCKSIGAHSLCVRDGVERVRLQEPIPPTSRAKGLCFGLLALYGHNGYIRFDFFD